MSQGFRTSHNKFKSYSNVKPLILDSNESFAKRSDNLLRTDSISSSSDFKKQTSPNKLPNSPIRKFKVPENHLLQQRTSIDWLKSRYKMSANEKYLKTKNELDQDQEIADVFQKIDYDMSGEIDISELHNICIENGL